MKIIIGLLVLYLILPFLGLFNYEGFGGVVSFEMKVLYAIHIIIELSIVLFFLFYLNKKESISVENYDFLKLTKISIILLLSIIFINLFIFGNYKILIGELGRGEFRTTLHFGFIYLFLTFYVPGMILSMNTFIYSKLPLYYRRYYRKRIAIVFILAVFIGFLTGFKSTGIFIAIMGLIGLNSILKIKNLIFIALVLILIMAISGYLFMNFTDFGQVFYYLFIRATSIAVDGTVGVYNNFPDGGDDSYMILLYNLGNKLASLITGFSTNSLEYLKIDLGRYIAYITYPSSLKAEVLSGAFNLTITNFGESIYLLGRNYFAFYSLFIGIYIGILINLYKNANLQLKITLAVYFITSVVIGGGRVTNIFAFTTFVYIFLVYLVAVLILNYIKIKV